MTFDLSSVVLPEPPPRPSNMEELWDRLHDTALNLRMDKAIPIIKGEVNGALSTWFQCGKIDELPFNVLVRATESTVFIELITNDGAVVPIDKWVKEHWVRDQERLRRMRKVLS